MKASPLLPWFEARGCRIGARGDWQVALGAAVEGADARGALTDASACPRVLVVGAAAAGALAGRGLPVPEIFTWARAADGSEVARVGAARFLVSGTPGVCTPPLDPAGSAADLLIVAHDCAAMTLTGPAGAAALAEFCVLPPAMLTARAWLLTQFAHTDVALSVDGATTRVVCAAADGLTLFATLAAAIIEQGGSVTGGDEGITDNRQRGENET